MKHRILSFLLAGLLACAVGCGGSVPAAEEDTLNILATTYPIYLLTCAVTEGAENVEVSLLVNEQTSCLHDYTLTVNDMKAIEKADIIVANGVGFEDFMSDALAQTKAQVIDCSEGIELLPSTGHHHHDHEPHGESEGEHFDPHYWLDPARAIEMVKNIEEYLCHYDSDNSSLYVSRAFVAENQLSTFDVMFSTAFAERPIQGGILTFHDGFQYFADAFGFEILKAIEEEEGAEASAAEIREMVCLIQEYDVPVIFTEENGSDSTARAIARETGVNVAALDMLMSGDGSDLDSYYQAMAHNVMTVINSYYGEGTVGFQ